MADLEFLSREGRSLFNYLDSDNIGEITFEKILE